MILTRRDVILGGSAIFIAWGFVVHWAPVLRYIGYSFVAGATLCALAIGALISLTSREKRHGEEWRQDNRPRTAALLLPEYWDRETAWLSKGKLDKAPLYSPSFVVSESLDALLDKVLRDFVTSWYGSITLNSSFTNSIDETIRAALVNIRDRLFGIDVVEKIVARLLPIISKHMKDFSEAERAIRGKNLNRNVTESDELDLAIAGRYRDGKLHVAASLAYSETKLSQQDYLRKIAIRLMPEVLPPRMIGSRAVSVLIKEIIACAVLFPLMQTISDADTWNQLMEAYGQTMLQDRKSVRKLRAALDEHASPAPKTSRTQSFFRLSAGDDERNFERFIRLIRQCNNLSDARRFRSEVASQLKRESIMPGQDQLYLRRLETGKRMLDQRVGKLGAVGSTVNPKVSRPHLGNGAAPSRLVDSTVIDILHDASGLSYFMEYMDRKRLMTLVQFWIVVDGFRNPLEDDALEQANFNGVPPLWTGSERQDLAQIHEAYLLRDELKVSEQSRQDVRYFLKAGRNATPTQYLHARAAIMRTQSTVLEELQEIHYPAFKRSDLYYKYLISDDSSVKSAVKSEPRLSKRPSIPSIPESPHRRPLPSLPTLQATPKHSSLRRNATSSDDLRAAKNSSDGLAQFQQRRSFEIDTSSPLFGDDVDNDPLASSLHSLGTESLNDDQGHSHQEHMFEAMEAALNDIVADNPHTDSTQDYSLEPPPEPNVASVGETDSPRSSIDGPSNGSIFFEKERERPNLASLGLVNTSSRIGVFKDDDLFGDEEKFSEDEHADPEVPAAEKGPEDEVHEAAPGDLGLAEAISVLTTDIERLAAQDAIVDTLTRKAELTNNVAELRILSKSKSSLQREIRRKELQRQQYIVQESDNSLYGRATVEIKSIMVGREGDGQEFALYVIEVQRKAGEHMSAATWAIARRFSEFHDLHLRLRGIYPAVRHLEFPRRRLVMKLQREFLHKRRVSLERYLRGLLQLPAVCHSRDLRAFLSQQAIVSNVDIHRDGERRDIISRIYNSVTDGMDDFLGNIPVLDQLSIAGQNLISAATSQFNTIPPTAADDTVDGAEAEAELEAFENQELEPFVKPICDAFLEVFELNRGNNWLRGRAVVVVLHQLLGGAVERKIRDSVKAFFHEDSLLRYINLVQETIWPGGQLRRLNVRTNAEKTHSHREASVILATLVPDLAGNVVGRANAQAAGRRIFATMNNPRLNTHLTFTLLDEVVGILFGDTRPR